MRLQPKCIFYSGVLLTLFLFAFQQDGLKPIASVITLDTLQYSGEQKNGSEPEARTITYEQIVILTDQFMGKIKQKIDDNYKVINYHTKEALLDSFENIATRDTAKTYIDFYYNEEIDGLYIIPTETPPWFIKDNDYDVIQLDRNKVKVIQENQSELYGDYLIEYEFSFEKDWKITKITHS